ncbi:MAG: 6-phosphogluconolactonase [Pseudomonadota bacterium]|nr:6-phosphogluconolactonase [Pseudomonadota bacterium]
MAEAPTESWNLFVTRDAMIEALTESLAADFRNAVAKSGQMLLGASGGSTPKPVYERLAAIDLPWSALTVLIVDERYVPLDDEFSNQRMIAASLLHRHAEASCVGLWSSAATLDSAARLAAERVRALPRPLDTVLLGMGEDGHFASCFPGADKFAAAIDPDGEAVVLPITPIPAAVQPNIERLTLSWAYIRRATRIVLAITGARKREVLLQAMRDEDPCQLPVAALFKPDMPVIEIYWSA